MKVVLYNAITTDGFIATKSGDSEWVTDVDVKIFDAKIKEFGCIVMGNRTYQQFKGDYFPKKEAINIVVSRTSQKNSSEKVVFVKSPKEAIKFAKNSGFKKLLLIGGGTINSSFLRDDLIDEIYLDVHPLVFGSGIKVFEGFEDFSKVKLIDSKRLTKGQVILHYKLDR